MTLLKAIVIFLAIALTVSERASAQVKISGEIVCRDRDGDTLCLKLSHLKTQFEIAPADDWLAYLAYDPAQNRKATWHDSLDLFHTNLPPHRSWLADYGLEIPLGGNYRLILSDGDGTTLLPNASYLAFANNLQDIGWKQSLLRLNFTNSEVFVGDFLIGTGEGSRLDHERDGLYLGAKFRWYLHKVAALQLAYSQNHGSLPKDSLWWMNSSLRERRGFDNQRMAVGLILTGKSAIARGLEASLGWQGNRIGASRANTFSETLLASVAIDPTEALSQSTGGSSDTRRQAWLASASYRILAEYLLAFHLGQFKVSSDTADFQACESLDGGGNCVVPTEKNRSFTVKEWTYGLGKIDVHGWSFLLESHQERYDRLYQNFHFLNGREPRQKTMQLVQARINWNW